MKKILNTLLAIYLISVFSLAGCESLNSGFWGKEKKFLDADGKVHLCSEESSYISSVEECMKCENERKIFIYEGKSVCAPTDCEKGRFHAINGNCVSCSEKKRSLASPEECAKCGKVRKAFITEKEEICAALCEDGMFQSVNGKCYPCIDNSLNPYTPEKPIDVPETTSEECNKCNGTRKLLVYDRKNYCVPIKPGLMGFTDKKGQFISL